MTTANLNLSVIEKRMLSASEAASYCGLATKHFKALCPVPMVRLAGRYDRYDKHDLNQWIENEKAGQRDTGQAAILERLG